MQSVPELLGRASEWDFEGQEDQLVEEFDGKLSAETAESEEHLRMALETIRNNPFWTKKQKSSFMQLSIEHANESEQTMLVLED